MRPGGEGRRGKVEEGGEAREDAVSERKRTNGRASKGAREQLSSEENTNEDSESQGKEARQTAAMPVGRG